MKYIIKTMLFTVLVLGTSRNCAILDPLQMTGNLVSATYQYATSPRVPAFALAALFTTWTKSCYEDRKNLIAKHERGEGCGIVEEEEKAVRLYTFGTCGAGALALWHGYQVYSPLSTPRARAVTASAAFAFSALYGSYRLFIDKGSQAVGIEQQSTIEKINLFNWPKFWFAMALCSGLSLRKEQDTIFAQQFKRFSDFAGGATTLVKGFFEWWTGK